MYAGEGLVLPRDIRVLMVFNVIITEIREKKGHLRNDIISKHEVYNLQRNHFLHFVLSVVLLAERL